MAYIRPSGVSRLHQRRWSFSNCVFDESNWTLTVAGRRVPMEIKPLELLRALLLRAGNVVSKSELLDAVWPDVEVVEASLTTAVRKLRTALSDDKRKVHIIETAPRIGYRLAVPVNVEQLSSPPDAMITSVERQGAAGLPVATAMETAPVQPGMPKLVVLVAGVGIATAPVALAFGPSSEGFATRALQTFSQRQAANALRKLDVGAVDDLLAAGWDPNTPFDKEGNGAINFVLNECEWNRGHDRAQMLLMVRTLIDGGARLDRRNVWGDTPYSIAKAVRYCGPDHPVTKSIRTMCYAGFKPIGDGCLASYELTADVRRDAGLGLKKGPKTFPLSANLGNQKRSAHRIN